MIKNTIGRRILLQLKSSDSDKVNYVAVGVSSINGELDLKAMIVDLAIQIC